MSCFSAVFRDAIGWKAVDVNPCRELKRLHEPSRDRYVDDAEFAAVYALASPVLQCMMDLATITGQREGDLLRLPNRDPKVYTDAGVVFRPGKSRRKHPRHGRVIVTSKTVVVEWSEELRAVVDRARALCGRDIRPTLICTRDAEAYTESGFRSNWHRLMTKATATEDADGNKIAPKLAEPFTFHDLRAKSATGDDLEEAHERLAHDDMRTTQTIYRRKPRRARAGRKVGS
jgi:integrase